MKPPLRTLAWGSVTALYFVLTTLGHLAFSLWLVNTRSFSWQGQTVSYSFRDALPWLLPVLGLGLLVWLVRGAQRDGTRRRVAWVSAYWLLWATGVAAVDRWLTFSVPEYVHYPQYALLAALLARTLDPERRRWPVGRLLLLTTLLGALDELVQYLWITVSYSQYFDFNDVLVNLLAAALGLMLYYGWRTPPRAPERATQHAGVRTWGLAAAAGALALFLVLTVGSGRVQLTPSQPVPPGGLAVTADGTMRLFLQRQPGLYDRWHPGHWRPRHWVLGPAHATAALLLVWLAWLPFAHVGQPPAMGRHPRRYDPAATPQPTTPS